jgi:alanyl-tRNA synthetase
MMPILRFHHEPERLDLLVAVTPTALPDGSPAALLSETIAHPGGGGQDPDRATLGGVPVLQHRITEDGIVVVLAKPIPAGDHFLVVDPHVRRDHSQQHTAQHLVSALLDLRDVRTLGYSMRKGELTLSKDVDEDLVLAVQVDANHAIRDALDITSTISGDNRRVEICGTTAESCSGTHVATTAALQAIVLRRSKTKTVALLAGDRLLQRVRDLDERERATTKLLSSPPAEHLDRIGGLLADRRAGRAS